MRKIVDYEIVSFYNMDTTVKYVKEGLRDGWQPYGELKLIPGDEEIGNGYVQAMVLYAD